MFPMTVTLTVQNAGQLAYLAAMTAPSNDGAQQDATATQVQAKAETKPKAEKPKAEKPVTLSASQQAAVDDTAGLEETNAGKSAPAVTAKPTAEAAKADAPAAKVPYSELQAAVLALHKLDATAAKPIAEAMGFANFKAMPEDKWAEALAAVLAKTEEVKGGV